MRCPLAAVLVFALAAVTHAAPAHAAERIKALVLDISSTDLRPSEVETLTSLVTAHLARYPQLDVLSGADIKRLVDLEAQKQSVGCDEGACLAELAGALGAQLVFFGQAGKLGSTIVLTLNVYDAAKGTAVARQPIEARDLGQLPALVGPAIDAMVQPMFERLSGAQGAPPPSGGITLRPSPSLALSARAKEVYEQQEMDICVDDNDRLKWWFCDGSKRYTENEFVRAYAKLTGKSDLNEFDRNRNPTSIALPATMVGGGALLVLLGAPVAYFTYVDKSTFPVLSGTDVDGTSVAGSLSVSAIAVGAALVVYGGLLMGDGLEFMDGQITDHSMPEPRARQAAADYNEAMAARISKEYGGGS